MVVEEVIVDEETADDDEDEDEDEDEEEEEEGEEEEEEESIFLSDLFLLPSVGSKTSILSTGIPLLILPPISHFTSTDKPSEVRLIRSMVPGPV